MTALYSLIAVTAARRLGLTPTFAHLESPSVHVDGHYNSAEEPDAHGIPITRGSSRDHRPDLNHVMLDLIVEHQAGIPLLMRPRSGNTSDASDFGQVVSQHRQQLHLTYGMTYLVADSALSSEEHLQQLADTGSKWITRVPATLTEAQETLPQADAEPMAPLMEGSRDQVLRSTYGGVAQRWVRIHSEPRRPQAQRTVDQHLFNQSTDDLKAVKNLGRTAFACAADAQPALATVVHGLHATALPEVTIRPMPRYRPRGRPGQGTQPEQVVYHIDGALASSIATREALVAQQRGFILATNALDATQLRPQQGLAGYTGQKHADPGFRFLKEPRFLASSLELKKPERIMALLMGMTVCLLVYAALAYRIRQALQHQQMTFPNQKGQPIRNPTARWVFHYFVGIHLRLIPGPWPLVLTLTEEHQQLLQLLGEPYASFYA